MVPESSRNAGHWRHWRGIRFDRIIRRESEFIRASRVGALGAVLTSLAGFTSFVSHSGAPYQVWVLPLRLTKSVFVGTSVIAFAYVNALKKKKLIPYYYLGQLGQDNVKVAVILTVPALGGVAWRVVGSLVT